MKKLYKRSLVWLRHDLRLSDHTALKASVESEQIYLIFNFDPRILKHLDKNDQRVSFIWDSLESMRQQLEKKSFLFAMEIL